jgi:hypothetical protein
MIAMRLDDLPRMSPDYAFRFSGAASAWMSI